MAAQIEAMFARQLQERKQKLEEAVSRATQPDEVGNLLQDIDRALEKISSGTFGLCETCHDAIEPERLEADPLTRYCVDHLSEAEQHALERDLDLARQIQTGLLPRRDLSLPGWESAYHYEPSGQVSGDYCDIIIPEGNRDSFFFIVGDVTGKGIAASILMSQLHATFRTLAVTGLPLDRLMERANRIFCEASLSTHFATLFCGFADKTGELQIVNAGHCPPLVLRNGSVETLASSGLPLGIACEGKYEVRTTGLKSGESLMIYTDGLTESVGKSGEFYGEDRLRSMLSGKQSDSPGRIISHCIEDLNLFSGNQKRSDDLTVMVVRKE